MTVLIEGVEMPKNCTECKFWSFLPCIATFQNCGEKDCPLIEVPEPHGRLGDLDALIDKVIAKYLEHERKGELVFAAAEIKQDIVDLISDAPTIIPASLEDEK